MTDHVRRRVLIVDDHTTFAELLSEVLDATSDLEVVAVAGTAADAVAGAVAERPDIVVIDIMLGVDDGLVVAHEIRRRVPGARIVVVSARSDAATLQRAAAVGANAFAPKTGRLTELLGVLRHVSADAMLVAPSMFHERATTRAASAPARLTHRELEVVTLMAGGATAAEIARALGISLHTVRGYIKEVHAKLGARTQLEAVLTAQRLGLVAATPP